MKSANFFFIITLSAITLWIRVGAWAEAENATLQIMRHIAMATELEFVLYGTGSQADHEVLRAAGHEAFAAVDALEQRISRWRPDSWTSLMNRNADEQPVTVDGDVFELMLRSRHFYETTQGAFDITVGPLLALWGFYGDSGAFPANEALKQVLDKVGLNHVILDSERRTVFFERPGMRVDFGGIGKGLALDRAAAVLEDKGIRSARLSIGTSTIVALGAPPEKAGWKVDIRSPYNSDEDGFIATVVIRDKSLSTSSGTERFVEIDGKRYSHIFDPRTGMPVMTGVMSATAIAPSGVESDALSTAFLVMGLEATRSYCERHPHVRAILVLEDGAAPETVYINFSSDGIKE